MTKYKILVVLLLLCSCSFSGKGKSSPFSGNSLTSIFEQLTKESNPFDFYSAAYESYKFEVRSNVISIKQKEDAPSPESVTFFENDEQGDTRFFKKSLDPISEVEWLEKQGKDFIRYDDSKHFLRTSYNPEFEKWKKRMFEDIQFAFDLKSLEKKSAKDEKNQWSCFETEQQKLCLDSKTGLPVFGKTIKQIKPETALSMVFTLTYGQGGKSSKAKEKK